MSDIQNTEQEQEPQECDPAIEKAMMEAAEQARQEAKAPDTIEEAG